MFDIKITGATIIDGENKPGFIGDIGITGDKITSIGDLSNLSAKEVIDAKGKVVCPGFIEIHSHSDMAVIYSRNASSRIYDGVTTDVIGNCGIGTAPICEERKVDLITYLGTRLVGSIPVEIKLPWNSVDDYLKYLEAEPPAINIVPLLAQGVIRINEMGFAQGEPTKEQLLNMQKEVAKAMEAGCVGMSSGLIYMPGEYTSEHELTELCKAMKPYGGYYVTHMRSEGNNIWNAIDEAVNIISAQREKIKKARHDNRYCNKDMQKKAVAEVKEQYADIIERVRADKNSLNEEETKRFNEYKAALKKAKKETITSKIQMIFQDPIASLNPRMTVRNIIAEGLIIQGVHDKDYVTKEVNRVLELVGLVPEHANRYPHEFSGGQRQRIGIARAIIMNPELIIADEPVSALDVSIQAQVINLLNDLRNNLGLTILFIAHNLSVVKYFCDRIAVMYYGNLVELTTSDELFAHPLHPYTKSLLSAVPHPDPNLEKGRKRIAYDASSFHDYSKQKPTLRELAKGHFVLCNDEEEIRYRKELEGK